MTYVGGYLSRRLHFLEVGRCPLHERYLFLPYAGRLTFLVPHARSERVRPYKATPSFAPSVKRVALTLRSALRILRRGDRRRPHPGWS